MDCMLSFLEPVCIIESCLSEENLPVIEHVDRGSDYDWSWHLNSLRQVKGILRSSNQWTSLADIDIDDGYDSLREYISRGAWLHEDLEDCDALQDCSCSTTSSLWRPDRIEWLKESHQSIIPCRSQHVERKPRRVTLEKTVKERYHRGLRLYCVRPEMFDMWEEYCSLVWNEASNEASPSSPQRSLWNSSNSSAEWSVSEKE
eukprot:s2312_g11.t1